MKITRRTALCLPLLASCKKQLSPTVFVDPALATLVSSDTSAMVGVRMQQIQSTPLYQRYIANGKLPVVQQFLRNTGLNSVNELWEMLIAFDPRGTTAMVRGRFSEMGMEPRAIREGVRRFGYRGFTLVGEEKAAVAFLNPTTAIAGPLKTLEYLIDHRNDTSGLPSAIQSRVSKIPSTNQIWFAGDLRNFLPGPTSATGHGVFSNLRQVLSSVTFISGGVDARTGMRLDALAETSSAEEANRVRDLVRGLAGMARLSTPEGRSDLLRVYDALRVEARNNNVQVVMDVGADLLDEVIRLSGFA